MVQAGVMDLVFHLKLQFDRRCHLAGLYGVNKSPALVVVSVHNKLTRESNPDHVVSFIQRIRDQNPLVDVKTPEQIEQERIMAERAQKAE